MTISRSSSPSSSAWATFFLCFVLLQTARTANGQNQQTDKQNAAPVTVSKETPVLVELFTSEGCSSCPPADALLEKMDSLQPVAGAQLIVLSEHVDYWDHDGWKDPNSSSALTDRQNSYEAALGLKTPYTPQFIVDGTTVLRQDDAQKLQDAFQKAQAIAKVPVRIEDVKVDAGNPAVLQARVATDVNSDQHGADVYVAVALDRVESQVLRGENGGRHLVHVAVVQQLIKVGKTQKGKSFDREVQLKLKPGEDPKNLRIIAFIQEHGPGKVLGAALRKPAN